MKTRPALPIAFVAIATVCALAQTRAFPTVRELMTPEEFRASGLSKLSDSELLALDAWVEQHSLRVAKLVGQDWQCLPQPDI